MSERRSVDPSAVLGVLADDRRRALLRHLADAGGQATVGELTEYLLGCDSAPDGDDARARIITELHHAHLPKLDAHDVVAYDADRNVVCEGPAADAAFTLLDRVDELSARQGTRI